MKITVPLLSPYYSRVLNTHIMFGIVESAIRAGAREIRITPAGDRYEIHSEKLNWKSLLIGLRNALEEMLMTHYATGNRSKIKVSTKTMYAHLSYTVFCKGAFFDPPGNIQRYPRELEAIYQELTNLIKGPVTDIPDSLKSSKSLLDKKTVEVTQQLDPTVNQWISFYEYKESGPLSNFEYALAWVGLYYYSTVHKFKRGSSRIVEVIQYQPYEDVELWELLMIKDLATKIVREEDNPWKISQEYGLLKTLLKSQLPPSLEEVPGLSKFTILAYGQENQQGKGWRIFKTLELPSLWHFVSYLKIHSFHGTTKFIETLDKLEMESKNKDKKDRENVLREVGYQLYSSVTTGNENGFYNAFRLIRRLGYFIDPKFMEAVVNYILEGGYHD